MAINPSRRPWLALLWLACGVCAGAWLARGSSSPFSRPLEPAESRRSGMADGERSTDSRRSRVRALSDVHPVTLQQLANLANRTGTLPSLDYLISRMSGVFTETEEKRENAFRMAFQTSFETLGFNQDEQTALLGIFRQGFEGLRDLETESLEVRQPKPGSLVFDFDALADARAEQIEAMRRDVEKVVGKRGLADLDVLAGFDRFIDPRVGSQNLEIMTYRRDGNWNVMVVVPGFGGRTAKISTAPMDTPLEEAVRSAVLSSERGRFAHLLDHLPETLPPPP
jgi:hypothetical protein